MPPILKENIYQNLQSVPVRRQEEILNAKGNVPVTFTNSEVLKTTSIKSYNKILKEDRFSHGPIKTFKRNLKTTALSNSADSIRGRGNHQPHQYSSDVILAQPQSYCESNNDLHYDSSDILANTHIHYFRRVNDSYSSEDNLSQPRGSLQDFVSSDGLSHSQFSNLEINNFSTSSEVSSLQGCGSPDSPPQAISPTGEFRNLLEKIQQLPNQKDGNKYPDAKSHEYLNYDAALSFIENTKMDDDDENNVVKIDENEDVESCCPLLNEPPQNLQSKSKIKKLNVTRPNKLLGKPCFPKRSKTFYTPLCHSAINLGKINATKSSVSAPVTPITNFPSPENFSLNFILNTNNKNGCSKNNLEKKNSDGKLLLLYDEEDEEAEEINDELF